MSLRLGLWRKSKELIRRREEKGGGILLKHSSFVEVLNKGKRDLGDVVWIESETEEVLSNLVSLKKCHVGRWDGSTKPFASLGLG